MSTHFALKTGRVAAGGSLLVGGIAGALVLAPQAGAASTYHVTNTGDTGAGSLRQAIDDANNNAGADIIVFDAGSAGTITLTSGQLDITDDVTITGLGAADSIISGNNASRIFYLYNNGSTAKTISISGLTLTEGDSVAGGAILNQGNDLTLSGLAITGNNAHTGGGVDSRHTGGSRTAAITIIDSEISNNSSRDGGGGVYLYNTGDVTITNSVISGNTTQNGSGGGIHLYHSGNVSVVGSTVNDNSVVSTRNGGGGVFYDTGVVTIDTTTFDGNSTAGYDGAFEAAEFDDFTMTNSTVSGNSAQRRSAFFIRAGHSDVLIANSTIADNTDVLTDSAALAITGYGTSELLFNTISGNSSYGPILYFADGDGGTGGFVNISGSIISDNTTLSGSGAAAAEIYSKSTLTLTDSLVMGTYQSAHTVIVGGTNITGVSAQLGALADNGGPTFTMEPATGSPVIDAGPLTWTAFTGDGSDQRSGLFLRVANGQSDMGALEVQPDPVPPTTTTTAPPSTTTTTLGSGDTTTTVATDPVAPAFTG